MNSPSEPVFPQSWLMRMPPALFALPYGLLGLTAAWRRAARLGWEHANAVSELLLWPSVLLWSLLAIAYAVKCLRFPGVVRREWGHPVLSAFVALIPLSTLLVVINLGRPDAPLWTLLTLCVLVVQAVAIAGSTFMLATGRLPKEQATPGLYLPGVGGGLIGGMAMAVLGQTEAAMLLFGFGVASWVYLETRVLNHLYREPMPQPLRPSIGIELAPACVTTLAAVVIWPTLPAGVLLAGLGFALWAALTVALRWRWWIGENFVLGFWSFSFPLAAWASVVLETVARAALPLWAGLAALSLASAVIGYLSVRTALLLWRGKLLPVTAS